MDLDTKSINISINEDVRTTFIATDLSLGIIIGVLFILYLINTWIEYRGKSVKEDGTFYNQVWFLVALLTTSASYIIEGSLIPKYIKESFNVQTWEIITLCTVGLNGYITSIAYAAIFFVWSGLSSKFISGKGFPEIFRNSKLVLYMLYALLLIYVIVISIIIILQKLDNAFEPVFASIRDVFLILCFIWYFYKMITSSAKPYTLASCNFTVLPYHICILFIFVLIIRVSSVLVYFIYWLPLFKTMYTNYEYYIEFLVEQVLHTLFPLSFISFIRLFRNSCYIQIQGVDNNPFLQN